MIPASPRGNYEGYEILSTTEIVHDVGNSSSDPSESKTVTWLNALTERAESEFTAFELNAPSLRQLQTVARFFRNEQQGQLQFVATNLHYMPHDGPKHAAIQIALERCQTVFDRILVAPLYSEEEAALIRAQREEEARKQAMIAGIMEFFDADPRGDDIQLWVSRMRPNVILLALEELKTAERHAQRSTLLSICGQENQIAVLAELKSKVDVIKWSESLNHESICSTLRNLAAMRDEEWKVREILDLFDGERAVETLRLLQTRIDEEFSTVRYDEPKLIELKEIGKLLNRSIKYVYSEEAEPPKSENASRAMHECSALFQTIDNAKIYSEADSRLIRFFSSMQREAEITHWASNAVSSDDARSDYTATPEKILFLLDFLRDEKEAEKRLAMIRGCPSICSVSVLQKIDAFYDKDEVAAWLTAIDIVELCSVLNRFSELGNKPKEQIPYILKELLPKKAEEWLGFVDVFDIKMFANSHRRCPHILFEKIKVLHGQRQEETEQLYAELSQLELEGITEEHTLKIARLKTDLNTSYEAFKKLADVLTFLQEDSLQTDLEECRELIREFELFNIQDGNSFLIEEYNRFTVEKKKRCPNSLLALIKKKAHDAHQQSQNEVKALFKMFSEWPTNAITQEQLKCISDLEEKIDARDATFAKLARFLPQESVYRDLSMQCQSLLSCLSEDGEKNIYQTIGERIFGSDDEAEIGEIMTFFGNWSIIDATDYFTKIVRPALERDPSLLPNIQGVVEPELYMVDPDSTSLSFSTRAYRALKQDFKMGAENAHRPKYDEGLMDSGTRHQIHSQIYSTSREILESVGLNTIGDFKQHRIYSPETLTDFIRTRPLPSVNFESDEAQLPSTREGLRVGSPSKGC